MKSPDDPCRITTSWSESTVALTLERSLTVFQKSRLSFSASVTPVTFNSRREFSETPRRIRPPSELANALYVSHRLSGNLSLAFFASIQLSSRSSLTSDSERPAKEINSITSEFATFYAFPPVYRHFIRLSASLPPLYTPFRQFFILGKPSHVRAASPPPLATLKTQKPETGYCLSNIQSVSGSIVNPLAKRWSTSSAAGRPAPRRRSGRCRSPDACRSTCTCRVARRTRSSARPRPWPRTARTGPCPHRC